MANENRVVVRLHRSLHTAVGERYPSQHMASRDLCRLMDGSDFGCTRKPGHQGPCVAHTDVRYAVAVSGTPTQLLRLLGECTHVSRTGATR